jgi:AcrR family transcriptional regulator
VRILVGASTHQPFAFRATGAGAREPRRNPRQERSRALVDAILTAAARVLASVGVEESTTTRIAERAGVSVGSLYQYFRDRDELLGALVERIIEENMTRFRKELESDAPPAERIEAMIRAGLASFLDRRAFYARLLAYAPLFSRLPLVLRAREHARQVLAREIRAHAAEGSTIDPDVAAFVIINAFMGVVVVAFHEEPGPREALEAELVRLFTRYLVPEARAGTVSPLTPK